MKIIDSRKSKKLTLKKYLLMLAMGLTIAFTSMHGMKAYAAEGDTLYEETNGDSKTTNISDADEAKHDAEVKNAQDNNTTVPQENAVVDKKDGVSDTSNVDTNTANTTTPASSLGYNTIWY